MKLWLSGQVEAEVGDAFRQTMNEIERLVNDKIGNNDYGKGLASWDIIFFILEGDSQESFNFDKRTATSDIRISLNCQNFKSLDLKERKKIFIESLIRSLDELRDRGVTGVNWENLKADLSDIERDLINS